VNWILTLSPKGEGWHSDLCLLRAAEDMGEDHLGEGAGSEGVPTCEWNAWLRDDA
jgi:hypothetical protein